MRIPIPINLAVEDSLSEAILRRLLLHSAKPYHLGRVFRKGGYGYLKKTVPGWNRAARSQPILVLVDLDDAPCASAIVSSWLTEPRHPNLIFRVAVREVESWLLADEEGFQQFLNDKRVLIPPNPDELVDPKQELIRLVARSRNAEIRSQIVPRKGSTASIGREYNLVLASFVETVWDPKRAAGRSPSLRRAIRCLADFQVTY